ncbi:MerR family transcriptional regulator [Actinocrispum wychmicini]|uniref:MerR family transcriptional regulator n=1 Tax=Actinocrispum wychmicini TaxID=1213861 RepID=UPI00104587CD|nr:MerR family transcriptional regulator [Actinocrispum wychmicini]
MLTIKRLAEYVGVTVRAVRHYHQTGLLPEPERDASGYRRYDAQAVVHLIRIKTMAEAGVPLTRIQELMAADPERFAQAVDEIDQALARQIEELRQRRRRVAGLVAGEHLFLPAEIAEYIEELRALGVSERGVLVERDGWIMLAANYPDKALEWIAQKRAQLADTGFRQFYRTYDQAHDWDPTDPRLADLADTMADRFLREVEAAGVDTADWTMQKVLSDDEQALLGAYVNDYSPAWLRLNELVRERVERSPMTRDVK